MQQEIDFFYRTHDYLVRNLGDTMSRGLMDKMDHSRRLIGIKGARGVGKTTFLLMYARDRFLQNRRECLYVNLNQFAFTTVSLSDFAGQFVRNGGRTLLLDQVFKCPGWSPELRRCVEQYPELQIIFTGSSVMRLKEENDDLRDICASYTLSGFSLREFINVQTGLSLPPCSLSDILLRHKDVAREILKETAPSEFMEDYLHHGYYPFYLEKHNYSENLLKNINMTLEVDVLFIRQVEQRYLHKLRKLLFVLSRTAPGSINISRLASDIETSRATALNYLQYLSEARLVNVLYGARGTELKKPSMYYLNNTNIAYVMAPDPDQVTDMYKTFFLNQILAAGHRATIGSRSQIHFVVDGEHAFRIEGTSVGGRPDRYIVAGDLEVGTRNVIPLWLFGFLY